MDASLAERLREGTRANHRATERAGIMPALISGRLSARSFAALQRNLHEIYAVLEPALARHADHAAIAAIHQPDLERRSHLAADLVELHGSGWRDEIPIVPATLDYVERIRQIDLAEPEVLVAHAYVRYLGDLSGGQVLKLVVTRSFKLDAGKGTGFYDFGGPDQVAQLARDFRAGLAAVPVQGASIDRLVAEAQWAFDQHVLLFCGLETV
jgi:heme oxygenase